MKHDDTDSGTLLPQIVTHFRLGMYGAGSEGLVTLIDRLLNEIQNSGMAPLQLNELSTLLSEVLAAQERRDLLYLADLLQYRLTPLVQRR